MRLWAEVYNAAGTRLGVVNLMSATVSRLLDGAGEIRLDVPASDHQAVQHLQVGRSVHLYTDYPQRRLIERGVLLKQSLRVNTSGDTVSWEGTDGLEDLRRVNTLRGLVYDNRDITALAQDLVGKVSGWGVTFNGVAGTTSLRFDGVSVLAALDSLREKHGYHFRLGSAPKWLEFGVFGSDSGVRVTNVRRADRALWQNDRVALIDRLDIIQDGYDIVNWIEPLAGNNDAALTLKRSTRNSPYPILTTTGPDGRPVYYLKDDASIATYGQVQGVVLAGDVLPVDATTTALVNAANVLYDWAAAYLQRHKDPQASYRVSAVKVQANVRPGDKIRLVYRGEVYQDGVQVRYVDLNQLVWVLKATERYNLQGQTMDWEVCTIDEPIPSPATIVAKAVTGEEQAKIRPRLNVERKQDTATPTGISRSNPASVTFTVRDLTVAVASCRVTLTRQNTSGPDTISLKLDGVEVPGGPWLWGSAAGLTVTVEIEETLTNLGSIQGQHTLVASPLYGNGQLEVKVELVEVMAGVR